MAASRRITCLVTPKCVFSLSPPQPPRLASLHPGVSLEEVRRLTGFRSTRPPRFRRLHPWTRRPAPGSTGR